MTMDRVRPTNLGTYYMRLKPQERKIIDKLVAEVLRDASVSEVAKATEAAAAMYGLCIHALAADAERVFFAETGRPLVRFEEVVNG